MKAAMPHEANPPTEDTEVAKLPRRGFVVTTMASGLALATAPAADAQEIQTGTEGLHVQDVQIEVSDRTLPAYAARPQAQGHYPIVLVVEEISGLHEYMRDVCRRLAHAGYLAVAADYYVRVGELTQSPMLPNAGQLAAKAPDDLMMSDMDHVAAWAARNGGDEAHLGVTGFCIGGRQAILYAAHNPQLRAAVAWYGVLDGKPTAQRPRSALQVLDDLKCPLLGLYGTKDVVNPMALIEQAEAEAKTAPHPVEIVATPTPRTPSPRTTAPATTARPMPATDGPACSPGSGGMALRRDAARV